MKAFLERRRYEVLLGRVRAGAPVFRMRHVVHASDGQGGASWWAFGLAAVRVVSRSFDDR